MTPRRSGYSLLEAIIVLGVGGMVLALCGAVGFHHQRFHRDIAAVVERSEQLEQVVSLLPISLRSLSPSLGDIAPGGARDTSLQFRGTIASAVVCDSVQQGALLAPALESPTLSAFASRPEVHDTAWILEPGSDAEHWQPRSITAVADTSIVCLLGGIAPFGLVPRSAMILRWNGPASSTGAVLRVTRPWRYSVYRAADGFWYFGAKEWSPASGRFNTIQPVAGPLLAASYGLRFQFFDSAGIGIPSGAANTAQIARIDVTLTTDSVLPSGGRAGIRARRGMTTSVALRNR